MFAVPIITAAATGGRFVPNKAQLQHTGTGTFRITNYDPNFSYSLSVDSGSISRSGDTISLSATTSNATVIASSPKGGVASAGTCGRKPYSYTADTRWTAHQNAAECGPGPDCSCLPGWGPHWDTSPEGWSINAHCSRDIYGGSAPALINEPGYSNNHGEWGKVG
jgi:hypothetical protein